MKNSKFILLIQSRLGFAQGHDLEVALVEQGNKISDQTYD